MVILRLKLKGDFLVDTPDPQGLDRIMQTFGAVLAGGPDNFITHEGHYIVRPYPATNGMPRFACEQQGYAKVVGDAPDPAPWDLGRAWQKSKPAS